MESVALVVEDPEDLKLAYQQSAEYIGTAPPGRESRSDVVELEVPAKARRTTAKELLAASNALPAQAVVCALPECQKACPDMYGTGRVPVACCPEHAKGVQ